MIGAGAALLAAGAGVLAVTGKHEGKAPAPPTARGSVDVFTVSRLDFDVATNATGDLRARHQIEIRNRMDSETTIVEIIEEGKRVKAGDVLVRLNAEPMQERLDQESLEIDSARAALVEAEEGYAIQMSENESALRAADLKLALAKLDLEKWRSGEVVSKRLELRHNLERATKEELRLREKLEKSQNLHSRGYYSLDLLKQDELAWEQSKADLAKRELDQRVYEEFEHTRDERQKLSDVEEAEAEVERVARQNISRLASKEATRSNRRRALQHREQKLQKLADQLAAATIKAPSDGLVVYGTSVGEMRWGGDDGPMQVGTRVWPNQLLLVLPDTSEMIAAVKVHESLAGRIRPGQRVNVKVDAAGDQRFAGQVESVGVLAEQSSRWMDPNLREYTVRVALERESLSDGRSEQLKPSMRCEAEIILGHVKGAVATPVQAVFNEGPVRFVHVLESGQGTSARYVRRPVQLGQRSDRFAEIRAGLAEGERVLVRRPEAGEVLPRPWDERELTTAGLKLNDEGQVVAVGFTPPENGEGVGLGMMSRPGGPRGPGGPAGRDGSRGGPAVVEPTAATGADADSADDDDDEDAGDEPDDGTEPDDTAATAGAAAPAVGAGK